MALPNLAMSFSPFAILTAQEMNDLVENIEALAAGTGLNNSVVTASKLATGAARASVTNSGTTTSTSYTATLGGTPGTNPSVTVVVGANGLALIAYKSEGTVSGSPAGQGWRVAVAISGATTRAASDLESAGSIYLDTTGDIEVGDLTYLATGLTPGSTTFTLQYKVSGAATGTFSNRILSVVPL